MKKSVYMVLAIVLMFPIFFTAAFAESGADANADANSDMSKVLIDGAAISFQTYDIEGNKYFKLRDIAFALNNTSNQFDVIWEGELNAVFISVGKPYTITGGELENSGGVLGEAVLTASRFYLNGQEITKTVYNIGGYNYFLLSDLISMLRFVAEWDDSANATSIITNVAYNDDIAGENNKLMATLGYTKEHVQNVLDNRTTFSQNNEHIDAIVKSLPTIWYRK